MTASAAAAKAPPQMIFRRENEQPARIKIKISRPNARRGRFFLIERVDAGAANAGPIF
jgi:hypothetical protein